MCLWHSLSFSAGEWLAYQELAQSKHLSWHYFSKRNCSSYKIPTGDAAWEEYQDLQVHCKEEGFVVLINSGAEETGFTVSLKVLLNAELPKQTEQALQGLLSLKQALGQE